MLKNDPKVVLAALRWGGDSLASASERLRNVREVALAAVRRDGRALQFESEGLKQDRELCQIANVRYNEASGEALSAG